MEYLCTKIITSVFVFLIAASLTLTSCAGTNTPVQQASPTNKPTSSQTLTPQYGGTLRIVPRATAKVFGYPGDMIYTGAMDISNPCLETLCGVDTKNDFMPKLATAAQFSADGKSITFTLRKGVKFHDGTDLNAAAAKWNLDMSKKVRCPGTETWTSIDVIDDYTVRINLKQYQNSIFVNLAISSGKISSPTAYETLGVEKIHTNPVGTGPFKFVSYTPDLNIKYEKFDDYWGGKPYLDGVDVIFIQDDMAKAAALQSGGVDVLFNVTSETAITLREKGYHVASGTQDSVVCMFPDSGNADSPLSNLKVREAVDYAIDKNALKELGNGFWTIANQLCTPNTPGYITNFEGRSYDPNKAKQLLAEAGYPDGFSTTLIFTPSQTAPQDAMVAVQEFLGKVGITADLQGMPMAQKTDVYTKGWHNAWIVSLNYAGLSFISALSRNLEPSGQNVYVSTSRPPGWEEALNQASMARDGATLITTSEKLVKLIYDDAAVIPLWVMPQNLYAEQTYVHDAGLYETGANFAWTPEKAWMSK